MTSRRDRPRQVRPRPPSSGRPRQLPPTPRGPVVPRAVRPRSPEPARGMPIVARLALVVAVVSLAAVVLATVSGALPRVVASIGAAFGGLTDSVLTTPTPAVEPIPIPPAPTLVAPESPYTNAETVTISGTVPGDVAGRSGYLVRVYVALPDEEPIAVRDVPVGETPSFVIAALPLEKGRNDITATIVGPGARASRRPSSPTSATRRSPRSRSRRRRTARPSTGRTPRSRARRRRWPR